MDAQTNTPDPEPTDADDLADALAADVLPDEMHGCELDEEQPAAPHRTPARRQAGLSAVRVHVRTASLLVLAGVTVLLGLVATPASASTATWRWKLYAGQGLQPGQELLNKQADERLIMRRIDGNLVLYRGSSSIWQSRTAGHPGAHLALQRSDGNLVIYAPDNHPIWQAHTYTNPGDTLVLQGDGNLVVYAKSGKALWATGTVARPSFTGLRNPTSNWPETSAFVQACFVDQQAGPCDSAARSEINAARWAEGMAPIKLPTNFESLSFTTQLVDAFNAERSARGLAALPDNGRLNAGAYDGAVNRTDPTGPAAYSWGSVWAGGYDTPLAAVFAWMYHDGLGGGNLDCTKANTSGCWGHRDVILSRYATGATGASAVGANGNQSMTGLFVEGF